MRAVPLIFDDYKKYLKARPTTSHKGDFGRVLIVGGHLGFSGSVCLAGMAALRVGAGCVTIATRMEHAAMINMVCPELMCHGIDNAQTLNPLLMSATVVVVGPGLAMDAWSLSLLKTVLSVADKAIVLDADALNLIALHHIKMHSISCVFTPHPGEAARLLSTDSNHIQTDRVLAIQRLCALLGGTVVLKGSGTLIATNTGAISICCAGNPGMATAGMGDVLSGVIAGLIAQRIPLPDAACLGVLVHAMAGDLAASDGGARGLIASDVIACLQSVVNL